jgi:uncharacterized membrane protein
VLLRLWYTEKLTRGAAMTSSTIDRIAALGRVFFAVGLVAFGIQTVIHGDFVTRAMPAWPAWIPAHPVFAYPVGAIMIAGGSTILFRVWPGPAAAVLATMFLLSVVVLHLPLAVADRPLGGTWTNLGKGLVLFGGVVAVTGSFHAASRSAWLGRCCLAAFMVLGGIQHFRWTEFVATLVPVWVPGGQLFWTYFAGVALIAGGVGLLVPSISRLAALASGSMMLLWVVLLHVPRALADLNNSGETTAAFEALAFSGLAFFLAAVPPGSRGVRQHGNLDVRP